MLGAVHRPPDPRWGMPMSDNTNAAVEAAQAVVDEVTSYEYSGDSDRIASALDEGFKQAGVTVSADERTRLVQEIDSLKDDEGAGTPQVRSAEPR